MVNINDVPKPVDTSEKPVDGGVDRPIDKEGAGVLAGAAIPKADSSHIIDKPWTATNWYQHLNWINIPILVVVPAIGIYGAFTTQLQLKTAIWAVIYYFCTGLGITAGYHRYWAHRSFTASAPLRVFLAAVGGGAVEGSIRWWSRDHRAHHRYTDTEKDPYSVRKGFWYSHLGWMILKQNPKKIGRTDIADLNADPIVMWQHQNYGKVAIFMGFIFPMLVAGLGWGDWRGGYFYAGVLRLVFVHHATFCVNSLAHWLGDQPFEDRHSPRDHILTAFATLGEGYHNFHHSYPSDYRNAIQWWQYDPTKWLIQVCKVLGLASDLKEFSANSIGQAKVQMAQKKLDRKRAQLDWGTPIDQLPVWEWAEFEKVTAKDNPERQSLIMVAGIVHDVSKFIAQHPGGQTLIKSHIGKDATAAFNGGVYDHSLGAHNLLGSMRVAVVRGGMRVEAWQSEFNTERKEVARDSNGHIIRRDDMLPTKTCPPMYPVSAA
ncbi:stearoyl-CoA 9-desaturase [Savitreella phatthalungensis]